MESPTSAIRESNYLSPVWSPWRAMRNDGVSHCRKERARLLGPGAVDSYGPDDVAQSGGMKVARHPHTGLATVSWLFEGRIDHIDSAGNWAPVRPGEVNLMNAGTGISHSEYSTADTTTLHGIQLWYAFPDKYRFTEPSLDWYRPNEIFGDGWRAKVFLGDVLGERSPVKTYIPLTGAEIRLEAGASVEIDLNSEHEHAVQQISGAVYVNGSAVPDDNLAFVPLGATKVTLTAGEEPVIAIFIERTARRTNSHVVELHWAHPRGDRHLAPGLPSRNGL